MDDHAIYEILNDPQAYEDYNHVFDPSCYPLEDLPQAGNVADQAFGCNWPDLDQILKFYPGQFVVISGIAGHGKSTFILNVIARLAREKGIHSFLYVPENERYLRDKMIKIWGNNPGWDHFGKNQCFVQSAVPHYISEPAHTLGWLLGKAELAVKRDGIELVLLDPWNELEHAKPRDLMMVDYIRECLMLIKQFCRALNAIVIVVAHPTKVANERLPGLGDIEGAMHWYNKCDNGLIIVRENHTAKVISQKVREVGAGNIGYCEFIVDPNTGIFTPQYGSGHAIP
jgi:twinkle protein